ncbi:peptidoglycan bridge formation glycyltransferase FemA/FemB family protein [Candidatus Amesbacteria bacterium]|nr:peptidoglycan bridge formation glycyltransferase FemA/FemB family protein [Candidatus Amesbacteria bacterium]
MENFEKVEDVRRSKEYGKYMEKIGWRVEAGIFVRKLGPVAIAKIQRTNLPMNWERILKRNRVIMCKLEPLTKPLGWKQDNWPLLGTKTVRVDLSLSEEKLLQSFKKDCRYCINKCQMSNVKCQINNYNLFYDIWRKSARRKNLWIPNEKEYKALIESFGKKCFCLTINDEAGAVILMHKKTAYYYYAGSAVKSDLPYPVVWEAIKEAKKRGCRIWDFEGVYDSRWPNKGWRGFSHFKKSFGGKGVEFPGCFTKWLWPF